MLSFDSIYNQLPKFIPLNVSSMFEPLKIEAYLNADDEDCLIYESYLSLITEQINQNKSYHLALLQDVGSSYTYCFDAIELNKWTENNWTNPLNRNIISQIFYFSILSCSNSIYLGRCLGWGKDMIPCNENNSLLSLNRQFIKIDGIDNLMNLKPFLKASVFVDVKDFVCGTSLSDPKISFSQLLKSQEKNNYPYIFAAVQDEDSLILSYFEGLDFKVWSKENSTNPKTGKKIANAFYCMFPPNTKGQDINFTYLGGLNESEETKKLIRIAFGASSGYNEGRWLLGQNYKLGKGVIQDFEQAVFYFKLAAEDGYTEALFELGVCYDEGLGLKKNSKMALAKWKKAISIDGHKESVYHLGLSYWEGKGVEKDRQIASLYFKGLSEGGHQDAADKYKQWELEASDTEKGQAYCLIGLVQFENNTEEGQQLALKFWNLAKEKKNNDAFFLLAQSYFLSFKKAQSSNEVYVERYYKAKLLELMKLDFNPKFEEILKYEKLYSSKKQLETDKFLTELHFELGIILYEFGDKVRDANKIIKWFKLAANKGHSAAQLNLGACYYNGDCVKSDSKEALKWLKLSAKQDNADAKFFLKQIQNRI